MSRDRHEWVKMDYDPLEDQRYMDFSDDERSYRGGDYKRPGYNPKHNSIRLERVVIDTDKIRLKPI